MEVLFLIIVAVGGYYFYRRSTAPKNASQSMDWVADFVLYHTAALFQTVAPGKMPDGVVDLIRGEMAGDNEVQLLGSMQNYTAYKYKVRSSLSDIPAVRSYARQFLRAEMETLNSTNALRRFIRRMHKHDTGQEMTDSELEAQFNEISADIKADDDKARALRTMLLRDWMEDYFERRHGKPVTTFIHDMLAEDV